MSARSIIAAQAQTLITTATSIVTLLVGLTAGQLNEIYRGAWLFHECKAAIRLADSGDVIRSGDGEAAKVCMAYIGGFIEALPCTSLICASGASSEAIIRVYVAYMEKHPKLLDEKRFVGLAFSLNDSYPCNRK